MVYDLINILTPSLNSVQRIYVEWDITIMFRRLVYSKKKTHIHRQVIPKIFAHSPFVTKSYIYLPDMIFEYHDLWISNKIIKFVV